MRKSLAQQIQGASAVVHRGVKDFDDSVQQLRLLLGGVPAGLDDLRQLIRLGVGQPTHNVLGKQCAFAVVSGVVRRVQPAVRRKVLGKLLLERDFLVLPHHANVIAGHSCTGATWLGTD